MSATANDLGLSNGPQEGLAPVKDRLTTTLFLAALFHGIVILGVTFTAPFRAKSPTPTLEVLILTNDDVKAADNPTAQYLAQRNQIGTGTTDKQVRAANPASSPLAADQEGVPDGNSTEYREAVSGQRSTEFLSSRSDRTDVAFRSGEDRPAQEAEAPRALAPTAPSPIATNATDNMLRLRGRQDGKYEVIPNTRESKIAPYLDAWRRKVERLGTMNFPQIARGRDAATGNPVLEVAIGADGSLKASIVRRSSGRRDLDQAAQSILRLASPFDPFPPELRKQYDELRFAYEWQFLDGSVGKGTVSVPASEVRE
jgi:protein TonB